MILVQIWDCLEQHGQFSRKGLLGSVCEILTRQQAGCISLTSKWPPGTCTAVDLLGATSSATLGGIRITSLKLPTYNSSAERAFTRLRISVCNCSVREAVGQVFCVTLDFAAFVYFGKELMITAQHIGCMM